MRNRNDESHGGMGSQPKGFTSIRLRASGAAVAVAVVFVAATSTGCATVAELRKVEARVINMERGARPTGSGLREQVADYVADIDGLREEMRTLEGRLEVAEKAAADALEDSRRARMELAQMRARTQRGDGSGEDSGAIPAMGDGANAQVGGGNTRVAAVAPSAQPENLSAEIRAYRTAHSAWQSNETETCVERFRDFLQTYPASPYADDAAFWMADCHYKQAEYKKAVLRFDEVVRNYPAGNKASDALYRQGESLLKLGPGFREAAKRAFERVVKEYPESPRSAEAKQQLELFSAG